METEVGKGKTKTFGHIRDENPTKLNSETNSLSTIARAPRQKIKPTLVEKLLCASGSRDPKFGRTVL